MDSKLCEFVDRVIQRLHDSVPVPRYIVLRAAGVIFMIVQFFMPYPVEITALVIAGIVSLIFIDERAGANGPRVANGLKIVKRTSLFTTMVRLSYIVLGGMALLLIAFEPFLPPPEWTGESPPVDRLHMLVWTISAIVFMYVHDSLTPEEPPAKKFSLPAWR